MFQYMRTNDETELCDAGFSTQQFGFRRDVRNHIDVVAVLQIQPDELLIGKQISPACVAVQEIGLAADLQNRAGNGCDQRSNEWIQIKSTDGQRVTV